MRKKIIAGNWKMNTNLNEGLDLAKKIESELENINYDTNKFGVAIATPFTHLYAVKNAIKCEKICISAQNIAANEKGAFTGEVSADMIKSVGATATLLGHSERRSYYNETNDILSKKLRIALDKEIVPIFCIGEVLQEREENRHFDVVKSQIVEVLFNLDVAEFQKVKIAYEPVWAIGTGRVATPEQAQEMHAFIRNLIVDKYGKETAENTTILYGGSCNPSNADGLFCQKDIDGGLIGGASLKAEDFIALVKSLIKF